MPTRTIEYRLAGFSAELDWRPLHFLKPLPASSVCSACGLVRPKTVLLPCSHTLCETCYEQCAEHGSHVCPLDGYRWQDGEVISVDFPADELFRRQVMCWNGPNGCEYVTAASRIGQHFHLDCGRHSVRCPKCSATVPIYSLISHLKYGFCSSITPLTSVREYQSGDRNARSDFVFRDTIGKQVGEVRLSLEQIDCDIKAHGERLNEISCAINSLKETQQQQVRTEAGERNDSVSRIMCKTGAPNEELKGLMAKNPGTRNPFESIIRLEKTLKAEMANVAGETRDKSFESATAIEAAKAAGPESVQFTQKTLDPMKFTLRPPGQCNTLCVFFVSHFKLLYQDAMKTCWALYEGDPVYLRGYNLSPGICLEKEGESVKLYPRLRLYKGNMDDALQWPFEHKIKLGVMHPGGRPDRVLEVAGDPCNPSFERPTSCSNVGVYFFDESLSVGNLIRDGYVKHDQLRVMFELLPCFEL